MKRVEWLECLRLARSEEFEPLGYLTLTVFNGCALDNKRRAVTRVEVASLITGHCRTLNGGWLHTEESDLEEWAKRFDLVG